MKKILSLIMAILMAFSVFTVAASAEDATEPTPETPAAPVECTHNWSKWTIDQENTCTEQGIKYRECTLCNKIETALIAASHTYGDLATVEPTCTTTGYTGRACKVCGYIEVVPNTTIIPAKGHTYGNWTETIAPTCVSAGSKERTCSVCNDVEKVPVAALGHKYVATVVAPDYDKDGYTLHKCSRCTDEYKDSTTPKLKGKLESFELGGTITVDTETPYTIDVNKCAVLKGDAKITTKTFKSSDEKVVTVDDKGVLTGKGLGTAKITVTVTDQYGNTKEDTLDVRVNFSIFDWFKFIGTLIVSAITIVLGGLDFSSLGQLFEGVIPEK